MDCELFAENIDLYIDGELNKKRVEAFETHLCDCEECRQEYEDTKYIISLFKQLSETSCIQKNVSASLLANIKRRLKEQFHEKFHT